jgi:hypothetical protein
VGVRPIVSDDNEDISRNPASPAESFVATERWTIFSPSDSDEIFLFSPHSRMKEENSAGNQTSGTPGTFLFLLRNRQLYCVSSTVFQFRSVRLHYAFYGYHSPISRLVPSLSELNWLNFIALNGRLAAAGQSKFFEADPFFSLNDSISVLHSRMWEGDWYKQQLRLSVNFFIKTRRRWHVKLADSSDFELCGSGKATGRLKSPSSLQSEDTEIPASPVGKSQKWLCA